MSVRARCSSYDTPDMLITASVNSTHCAQNQGRYIKSNTPELKSIPISHFFCSFFFAQCARALERIFRRVNCANGSSHLCEKRFEEV